MTAAVAILAQSTQSGSTMRVVLWVGLLIGAAMLLGAVVMVLRAKLLMKGAATAGDVGPLEELRRLRDAGQITTEEFAAARTKIAAKVRDSAKAERPVGGKGSEERSSGTRPPEGKAR